MFGHEVKNTTVRPADEIERARGLLLSVMRGEIPRRLIPWTTTADEVTLRTAAGVLCWLCGEDDGDDFALLLEVLERARIRSHITAGALREGLRQ